jgi:hypothetical protein
VFEISFKQRISFDKLTNFNLVNPDIAYV